MIAWAVLKLLPLVLQTVIAYADETIEPGQPLKFWVAGFSPIGTLFDFQRQQPLVPGLLVQLALAVGATLLAHRARAKLVGRGKLIQRRCC